MTDERRDIALMAAIIHAGRAANDLSVRDDLEALECLAMACRIASLLDTTHIRLHALFEEDAKVKRETIRKADHEKFLAEKAAWENRK